MSGLRLTREEVFERFKDVVRHVWRNADFVLPHVGMSTDEPKANVFAALVVDGKPRAIGDSLIQRARGYRLLVADSLLALPDVEVRRILIHEAVHIGYLGHGAEFRRLVAEKGGVIAGHGVDSGGVIEVQKKVGHRFQTVRTFPQEKEAEAEAWGKEQSRAARAAGAPERWRLQWGGLGNLSRRG